MLLLLFSFFFHSDLTLNSTNKCVCIFHLTVEPFLSGRSLSVQFQVLHSFIQLAKYLHRQSSLFRGI